MPIFSRAKFRPALNVVFLCVLPLGCGVQITTDEAEIVSRTDEITPIAMHGSYAGGYPIRVVCTTGMVADLARNVGGGRVEVVQLMGAGVDPHRYKTTPGDVRKLRGADVILYSGLRLEGKMGEVFGRLARFKPAFGIADHIHPRRVLKEEENAVDPHVWFDVSMWREAMLVVRDIFQQYDQANAADYARNADRFGREMDALHEYAGRELASIPKRRRVLVTAHDAFQYFGRAYDVEVRGIQGISTEDEAGVKRINELVSFLVERGVKAVFVETSVSDRNIRALVEGCQARGSSVVVGAELYSDALGEYGTPEGTYLGMVKANVDAIVGALR